MKENLDGASCALGDSETGRALVLNTVRDDPSAGAWADKIRASFAQQSCSLTVPKLYILANQQASKDRSEASDAGQSSLGRGMSGQTQIPGKREHSLALQRFHSCARK